MLLEHSTNVEAGADDREITNQVVLESVDARDAKGKTRLYFVSERPWEDPELAQSLSIVAQLLLELGANVNALSIYGFRPVACSVIVWEGQGTTGAT